MEEGRHVIVDKNDLSSFFHSVCQGVDDVYFILVRDLMKEKEAKEPVIYFVACRE